MPLLHMKTVTRKAIR